MATYQISPPQSFNFAQPDKWPRWIRRFEQFQEASGLKSKESANQVNTLMYCMGDEADDILSSLGLSDDDKKSYNTIKTKLEGHFVKHRNIIYECAKFNQRQQEEDESADSFVTSLHCLAEYCGYEGLKNEMIRDRIVVGLRDANLSVKLQMVPDLSLEKAVTLARQSEAMQQQQSVVRGSLKLLTVLIFAKRAGRRCQINMHKPLLQGYHKNKHVQGVASLLTHNNNFSVISHISEIIEHLILASIHIQLKHRKNDEINHTY